VKRLLFGLWLASGVLPALPGLAAAQGEGGRMGGASARLEGNILTLSTGAFTRTFDWNLGRIASRSMQAAGGPEILMTAGEAHVSQAKVRQANVTVPGLDLAGGAPGRLTVSESRGHPITPDHLVVEIRFETGQLEVRHQCRLFPGSPAIGCSVALRGAAPADFVRAEPRPKGMIETDRATGSASVFRVDALALPGQHWQAEAIAFTTATDHNDTLVQASRSLLFRQTQLLTGNLLVLRPHGAGRGRPQVFLLRETPPGSDQVGFAGYDWGVRAGLVEAVASGFTAGDMAPARWTEAGAVVVGMAASGSLPLMQAVRGHMETVRPFLPARDMVATSNSWGDRSRDGRMSETFMLREIEAAAALGLSHVQLDDGWQAGLSKNSANRAGQRWEDWRTED
jgi:alpha-galactosidase